MQAIRQLHKVNNGTLIIDLPDGFDAQEVEVIILAKEPAEKSSEEIAIGRAIQKFLTMDTSNLTIEQKKKYERNCEIIKNGIGPDAPRILGALEGFVSISEDFNELPEEELELFYADNLFPKPAASNPSQ